MLTSTIAPEGKDSSLIATARARYDAAYEALELVVTRNAQRFAASGAAPEAEDCEGEAEAREALRAARAALVALLDPSELQPPEI